MQFRGKLRNSGFARSRIHALTLWTCWWEWEGERVNKIEIERSDRESELGISTFACLRFAFPREGASRTEWERERKRDRGRERVGERERNWQNSSGRSKRAIIHIYVRGGRERERHWEREWVRAWVSFRGWTESERERGTGFHGRLVTNGRVSLSRSSVADSQELELHRRRSIARQPWQQSAERTLL